MTIINNTLFDTFPVEIQDKIFQQLNCSELVNLKRTCKGLHNNIFHFLTDNPVIATDMNNWKWKKWKGQVLGNEKEILEALKVMGREPADFKELENVICENRTKALNELLEQASHWY